MKKKDEMDDERRGFLKKVASVSIATAFGGLVVATKAGAAQPTQAVAQQRHFRITQKGAPPNAQKPEGSDFREGDLAIMAAKLDEHPDVAVRAVLMQTAMGLASNDGARADFEKDVHGALRKLNIDLPAGLLPKTLRVPKGVHEAASKRKGWGIGGGHSNWNKWTNHNNHQNHSQYADWW